MPNTICVIILDFVIEAIHANPNDTLRMKPNVVSLGDPVKTLKKISAR